MAKRKPLNIDDIMDGKLPTASPRKHHEGTTEVPQQTDESTTKAPLRKYHIRLSETDWKAMQRHFSAQGIPTTTGIRMWIRERMREEGL